MNPNHKNVTHRLSSNLEPQMGQTMSPHTADQLQNSAAGRVAEYSDRTRAYQTNTSIPSTSSYHHMYAVNSGFYQNYNSTANYHNIPTPQSMVHATSEPKLPFYDPNSRNLKPETTFSQKAELSDAYRSQTAYYQTAQAQYGSAYYGGMPRTLPTYTGMHPSSSMGSSYSELARYGQRPPPIPSYPVQSAERYGYFNQARSGIPLSYPASTSAAPTDTQPVGISPPRPQPTAPPQQPLALATPALPASHSPISIAPALFSNYFPLVLTSPISKYSLSITPTSPFSPRILQCFLRTYRSQLHSLFGRNFLLFRDNIFCPLLTPEAPELPSALHVDFEGQQYSVKVGFEGLLSQETLQMKELVLDKLLRKVLAKLGFKLLGVEKNLFDNLKARKTGELEIWPGFRTAMKVGPKESVLVNVDSITKVVRRTTALELVLDVKRRIGGSSWEAILRKDLVGLTILTTYSKVIYKIEGVEFGMSPMSSFDMGGGKMITFLDYYKERYQISIKDRSQPLLVNKPRRGKLQILYLIPELCELVGLSEKQRRDPKFMRDINQFVKPNPVDRMKSTIELPKQINQNSKCKEILDEWKINFDPVPLKIVPKKIDAGCMIMGDETRHGPEFKFNLESSRNLDRDTQVKMLNPVEIRKLIIFFPSDGLPALEAFQAQTGACLRDLGVKVHETMKIEIRNHKREEDWTMAARKYITDDVSFVVYIINGPKKNGFNYSCLKSIMLAEKPVPSQMILSHTLKGINLKSIVYRIWTQINTKLGGVPWCVDSVPFVETPTMIVGISYSKYGKHKKSFSFLATINSTFSRYWSNHIPLGMEVNEISAIRELMRKAMLQFEDQVSIPPEKIFVFREGNCVGKSGPLSNALKEVEAMRNGIYDYWKQKNGSGSEESGKSFEEVINQTHLVVIAVDKNACSKFYGGDNLSNLYNPQQGTLIDTKITSESEDFFLISQRTNHGTSAPTHYQILHNDLVDRLKQDPVQVRNDIAVLSYKLCFLYYNTIGSIKTPAPLHYANKLTELVDRHRPKYQSFAVNAVNPYKSAPTVSPEVDSPAHKLQQMNSLYFI